MQNFNLPKFFLNGVAALLFGICFSPVANAQEGLGEQIGAQIDRGFDKLGDNLREGWASLQKTVDNFNVQARVYSRLHWDKQLVDAELDVDVQENGVILLRGVVADAKAKTRATTLAENTVGVNKLLNQLTIADRPIAR